MLMVLTHLTGGIGLFLLGMSLMTDSLKAMAGDSLRQWLGRFTGSPIKAMFFGISFTMIVQSSTATTLATIGFVSAGVLSFVQAIGIIIGANIGTTSTGWMVAFLGLKFSITVFALPMIGIGAMLKLLGKEFWGLLGLSLAGFGLLFLGIDFLQDAMAGFAGQVDLTQWSDDTLRTQLILVMVGLVMTVLLQSSTAAVTATLAALASNAIDLPQALALVIGQNIGTVATAILAAIGATVSAKRTAAVHVLFNVITAIVVFFVLMPATLWLVEHRFLVWDNMVVVAAFHTAFSLLGAMLFMPFTKQMQKVLQWLIPEKEIPTTRFLDDSLFSLPAVAIDSAKRALCQSLSQIYEQIILASRGAILSNEINGQILDDTLAKIDEYLEKMPVSQAKNDQQQLSNLLRLVVYSRMIREDLSSVNFIDILKNNLQNNALSETMVYFQQLTHYLSELPINGIDSAFVKSFVAFGDDLKAQKDSVRFSIVEQSASQAENAAAALELITAQRWLDKFTKHTTKMVMILDSKNSLQNN